MTRALVFGKLKTPDHILWSWYLLSFLSMFLAMVTVLVENRIESIPLPLNPKDCVVRSATYLKPFFTTG